MFISQLRFPTWAASIVLLTASACLPARPSTHSSAPTDIPLALEMRAPDLDLDLSSDTVLHQKRLACAVLASNPELAAWHDSWRAASARVDQPTSFGDTSVSYALAPGSLGSNVVRYGQVVQIEQSFRLRQTQLERRVARARADAARHDVATKRQQLVLVATALFDEYYTLTRALETNAEHEDLVNTILEMATARYSTGHAPQQDPIQAELEVAHIEHERIILQSQRDVVAAQLNGLLHRPPDTPLPPPPDRIPLATTAVVDPQWRRPETESARANEEAAQQAKTLAQRRSAPSIKAFGTYNSMWATVQHQFMVGAGISIPLQLRSLRAGVDEAEARTSAARHRREAVDDAIAVDRAAARHRLDEADQVVELHRERLIPTARARIEAARAGYETGSNDFSTVIEAERELRSLDLAYHRALARLNDMRAELDFALGRPPGCNDGDSAR